MTYDLMNGSIYHFGCREGPDMCSSCCIAIGLLRSNSYLTSISYICSTAASLFCLYFARQLECSLRLICWTFTIWCMYNFKIWLYVQRQCNIYRLCGCMIKWWLFDYMCQDYLVWHLGCMIKRAMNHWFEWLNYALWICRTGIPWWLATNRKGPRFLLTVGTRLERFSFFLMV